MKCILLFFWLAFQSHRPADTVSIYSYTIATPGGTQYPLTGFQGQKLLFIILPATQTGDDSAYLQRIDSITLAHPSQLKVIAVPSFEDGYTADSANTLLNWYQTMLDTSIIISNPLYTHKTSGTQQDSLFQWLTTGDINTHFDIDVRGQGSSFFVSGQGELYGVFGPEARNSDRIAGIMLQ